MMLDDLVGLNVTITQGSLKVEDGRGTCLAQSVRHATLDCGVVSSSPTLHVKMTLKKGERVQEGGKRGQNGAR